MNFWRISDLNWKLFKSWLISIAPETEMEDDWFISKMNHCLFFI